MCNKIKYFEFFFRVRVLYCLVYVIECVRIFKLEVGNIWYRRLRCLLSYYNAWEDCGLLSRLPLYKLAIFDIIDSSFAWLALARR